MIKVSIFSTVLVFMMLNTTIEAEAPLTMFTGSFPEIQNKSLEGGASYYDYVLKSGWSSVGHRVCATRDFVRGSMVRATNVANGKSVDCKVTDYGPSFEVFPDRIIDLSSTAFSMISDKKLGVADVIVEQLDL